MLAQFANREGVAHEVVRRPREQNLPPVPGGHDPRRSMHIQAHVIRRHGKRLSGMDPDSDSQFLTVRPVRVDEPPLSRNGGSNGIFCARKRDEESVALAVDFITAVPFERVAQKASVQVQSFRVSLRAELPQGPCGALDIAEQHGDGAGRLADHARHYRADLARREEGPLRASWTQWARIPPSSVHQLQTTPRSNVTMSFAILTSRGVISNSPAATSDSFSQA